MKSTSLTKHPQISFFGPRHKGQDKLIDDYIIADMLKPVYQNSNPSAEAAAVLQERARLVHACNPKTGP